MMNKTLLSLTLIVSFTTASFGMGPDKRSSEKSNNPQAETAMEKKADNSIHIVDKDNNNIPLKRYSVLCKHLLDPRFQSLQQQAESSY